MDLIHASDLKTILHSKRANIYLLEHCRILVKDGRVEYVTEQGKASLYWNIPIANTSCILLGTGTSITQAAVRYLASAGVMIGFCGGGGTPLFVGTECDFEVSFFSPQSEYRPTEYLQKWTRFWFDDEKRLNAAKMLQLMRLECIKKEWLRYKAWEMNAAALERLLGQAHDELLTIPDHTALLTCEGRLTKQLFKLAATAARYDTEFKRAERGMSDANNRAVNGFLDHGNYLAYGLGATACWVLGLPHGLAILHGKTRRGGLVFDAADIIKDAMILPQAFISAAIGHSDAEFRQACIAHLNECESLDVIIEGLKQIADMDVANEYSLN